MSAPAPFPRKTLWFSAIVLVVNWGGAYLLDAMGLVEGLLSPNGGMLLVLLPLALVFYSCRLLFYFVVPGLLVGQLALWGLRRKAASLPQK